MKTTGLKFAEGHLRAQWIQGDPSEPIKQRATLYEHGELYLRNLELGISELNEPMLLRSGKRLMFSRLAWAHYCIALGVNREFVRERLRNETGREILCELAKTILQDEHRGMRRTLFLMVDRHSNYIIREMMRDVDGNMPTEGLLWEYLQGHEWWTHATPPKLLGARLSDYGHTFRYLVHPAQGEHEPAVIMDLVASTVRKIYYAQSLLYVKIGDMVVPCRVDHQEIGGKTTFKQLNLMPEAVRNSLDATLDYMPAFMGKLKNRQSPAPGIDVFAAARRCCIERKVPRDARRLLEKRLAQASWDKPLTLATTLEVTTFVARYDTDQPEIANRFERVSLDLLVGDYTVKSVDLEAARAGLRETAPLPELETRTWGRVQSPSGASA